MIDIAFLSLSTQERERRTREGEARAALRLGLTVDQMNAIIAGPPRRMIKRSPPRCPACRRPL
jgi:hypothetical protein